MSDVAMSEAMQHPGAEQHYDVIVIGAGPVGENLADRAHQGGLSVAIVESELVGGECSYWACMPSKALLRPAAALRAARAVGGAKEVVGAGIDVDAALRRRDTAAAHWRDDGQVRWLDDAGISLHRGRGAIDGPRRVRVTHPDGGVSTLIARHAVAVCTGSAAVMPEVPGLAAAKPWTSREATSAQRVPEHLAILGGGVVGCEMATAFSSLGAGVTLISRGRLLASAEPFAGEMVQAALDAAGVEVRTGVDVASVARDQDGLVTLTLADGATVRAHELLVATGRRPRTEGLELELIGLESGTWLDVDDTMLVTGTDWLYAAGDVTHRSLLTHQGKYQARAAGDAIAARAKGAPLDDQPWGRHVATADHHAVPQVVFTDPEVASVGVTAAQAERAGLGIRVVDYDLGAIAGASSHADEYAGRARAIVDTERGVLIGVTFVGADVAELLQAATIAVACEVPIERLWHAVPSYPTISEVWLRLLEVLGRETASRRPGV